MLVVPIVGIALVGSAYLLLVWFGTSGRPADGPEVTLAFSGCAEAAPVVQARLVWMGLEPTAPELAADGFSLSVQLPSDPRTQARIPDTLVRPGRFEVRPHGATTPIVTEADIADATAALGFLDHPKALVQLTLPAARRLAEAMQGTPTGRTEVVLDGETLRSFDNVPAVVDGQVFLDHVSGTGRDTLDFAAETAVRRRWGSSSARISARIEAERVSSHSTNISTARCCKTWKAPIF